MQSTVNQTYLQSDKLTAGSANRDVAAHYPERKPGARSRDLAGQRFGKLIVQSATDRRADGGSVVWLCQCDCGKKKEVSANRLRKGKVRSCGCLSIPMQKDLTGEKFGRLTVMEYAGRRNPNTKENFWLCRCDCGSETYVGQTELQNGDTKSCGCYLRDTTRDRLKLVDGTSITILERNRNKIRVTNKSGCTGVYQDKSGKWIAYINFKKKRYWLGRFDNKDDAVKARARAEEIHEDFVATYYEELEKENRLPKR